jgi:hypothetical protein
LILQSFDRTHRHINTTVKLMLAEKDLVPEDKDL